MTMVTDDGEVELTDEEVKAVQSLKRLARRWPRSLGLFSWSGSLLVVKLVDEGHPERHAWPPNIAGRTVTRIAGITNDGGDPDDES